MHCSSRSSSVSGGREGEAVLGRRPILTADYKQMAEISSYIGRTALLGGRRCNRQHTSGQRGVWQHGGCSQSASKESETGFMCGVIEILGKLVRSTSAHLWIWSVPVPGGVASRQQCRCFAVLAPRWSHISQHCQRSPELFVRPSNVDVIWETVFFATDVYVITTCWWMMTENVCCNWSINLAGCSLRISLWRHNTVNRFETGFTNPATGCTENPVLTAQLQNQCTLGSSHEHTLHHPRIQQQNHRNRIQTVPYRNHRRRHDVRQRSHQITALLQQEDIAHISISDIMQTHAGQSINSYSDVIEDTLTDGIHLHVTTGRKLLQTVLAKLHTTCDMRHTTVRHQPSIHCSTETSTSMRRHITHKTF